MACTCKGKSGYEKGTILITTMVVMLLIILTATFLFTMSSHGMAYVRQLQRSTQAKALSDTGLMTAFASLRANFQSNQTWSPVNLGLGSYSTSVTTSTGRSLVTSTGTVQGKSRTSTVEIQSPIVAALDFALASGSSTLPLWWSSTGGGASSGLTGNVYSAGVTSPAPTIGAYLSGTLTGNLTVAGNTATTGVVTGTTTLNSTAVVAFPVVNAAFYQSIASTNGYYYTSSVTFNAGNPIPPSPAGGVIYVNGNITINGTQTTTACLVATGNISMTKVGPSPRVTINQYGNYPAMITLNGSITFTNSGGNALFDCEGLVYSGGNIFFDSNQSVINIRGAVLARGYLWCIFVSSSSVDLSYVAQSPPGMTLSSPMLGVASYNT